MTEPDPGARDHAPPGTERLLAGLTPEQAAAVTHGAGPLLLLAGPGAGKTRTLTHRAAYLLAERAGGSRRRSWRSRSASAPPANCGCGSPTCWARTSPAG